MIKLQFTGDCAPILPGVRELLPQLGAELGEGGLTVEVCRGESLMVAREGNRAKIAYAEKAQFFRALGLLLENLDGERYQREETPCFDKNGVMFDVSRNAVLRPDALRGFFRKMALMGLNLGMMYTEETYEVPSEPYFGYLRGRYSAEDLRALDDYADQFGIELVPCIQTLAHLERALHWPAMARYADTNQTLLADEDATYDLIERMITAASAPYRSKRIHIGMDEAEDLGLGNYRKKHGLTPGKEIMRRHLGRVDAILKKHGLSAMMWSDMHFKLASKNDVYYDENTVITPEIAEAAPEDIELIYWDYYHEREEFYESMLQKHRQFKAPTVFAGGVWTWVGPVPPYGHTLDTTLPALAACRKAGVREVFATVWGDNGAECSYISTLYGLQLYAEYGYTGGYDPDWVARRFAFCTGGDAEAFLGLTEFNAPHLLPNKKDDIFPVSKLLLYQDPLVPLFTKDFEGLPLREHYEALAGRYEVYAAQAAPEYTVFFQFYVRLARVLALAAGWQEKAAPAVKAGDRGAARELAALAAETAGQVEMLASAWQALWFSTNRPNGYEVIDLRLGGLMARYRSAMRRMTEFAEGKIDDIPELTEERLPFAKWEDGTFGAWLKWADIASPCNI
jgi:hexosaminidase